MQQFMSKTTIIPRFFYHLENCVIHPQLIHQLNKVITFAIIIRDSELTFGYASINCWITPLPPPFWGITGASVIDQPSYLWSLTASLKISPNWWRETPRESRENPKYWSQSRTGRCHYCFTKQPITVKLTEATRPVGYTTWGPIEKH